MTSFRVGVARDVHCKTARAALAGARTQSEWLLYTITIATVLLWAEFVKFCESFDLAMAASVNKMTCWKCWRMKRVILSLHQAPGVNETTKLMGMGISYSVHRNCKGNLASDKNKRLLLLSLFILPL